ncbi:MAG TPA: ABC transporter permease [Vicinamibacterales bacterium]|jgi:ABC-type transport system involved in multi-copper enzyme maturation permease subunit
MTAPLFGPTRRVFELALGEMLWARRTALLALAAGAPILIAVLTRLALVYGTAVLTVNGSRIGTQAIFETAVSVLYLRFIVPALGVFYGTSLIADEVEEKTITYLFTRPIARGSIVLGKYLAYLLCVVAIVLPSLALVFLIMVPFPNMRTLFGRLLSDLGMLALGLAAYGAVFLWAGVSFRRPLVGGLLFVFGWEPLALVLPGYLRYLTIAYYLQAGPSGVVSVIAIAVAAVLLSMRTIERREYVLEQ